MAADTATMIGLCVVFAGLLSISYKLNDSEQQIFQHIGILFLALSLATLQIVGWAAIQIADNAGYAFLTGGIATTITWITGLAMFVLWFALAAKALWALTVWLFQSIGKKFGGQVHEQ